MQPVWIAMLLGTALAADPSTPSDPAPETVAPFEGAILDVDEDRRATMRGVSMHDDCPVGFDDLVVLRVAYWNDDGARSLGELVVARAHAPSLRAVFEELYALRFPIHSIQPIEAFGGSDDASMAANNTSAFNCRPIAGGTSWSRHSYGDAIDLNPLVNPYVRGERVLPPAGRPYVAREPGTPGIVLADDPVVRAFAGRGWSWGGSWTSFKDYQHFSVTGR